MIAETTEHLPRDKKCKSVYTVKELKQSILKRKRKVVIRQNLEKIKEGIEFAKQKAGNHESLKINMDFYQNMYQSGKNIFDEWIRSIIEEDLSSKNKQEQDKDQIIELGSSRKVSENEENNEIPEKIKYLKNAHWDDKEKELFLQIYPTQGKDWKNMAKNYFPNKTEKQLRNFFHNNKTKYNLS